MSDERAGKNQVFTGEQVAPHVDPAIQRRSAADAVKSEFGLEIPVEVVPLPSGGKVYPAGHPFHDKTTVEITAMTAREEDILTSQALIKKGTVISELIKSCLVEKNFDVRSLLSGDRNALMVAIRITGYGADYEGEVQCPACSETTPREFNLSSLPIKSLDLTPVEPGQNLFEFKLPKCQKVVRFKFLTGADEEDIAVTQERSKKMLGFQQKDSLVTTNLLYSLVSVDGNEDRQQIARFVGMMPAMDSQALRKYMRENEPGVRMKSWSACLACGHEEEVTLPLGVKFLWPNAE